MRFKTIFILLFSSKFLLSQGIVRKINTRPEDVIWSKIYIRSIDLKEEINSVYYTSCDPLDTNVCLFDVIKKGLFNSKLNALDYNIFTGNIGGNLSQKQVKDLLIQESEINYSEVDTLTGNEVETRITHKDTLASENIVKYYVKEQWFLDKQRSVLDSRIIAICPVKFDVEKQALQPLFWVDFDESADYLNKTKVVNRKNYNEVLSYYQLLLKRRFYSQIIYKEGATENPEFESEAEAIMNSEKLKTELVNFECDLWHW